MRRRVLARYRAAGADAAALELLDGCLTPALAVRERTLAEADPRLLHPARTTLILLDDAAADDPVLLAAAPLLDSVQSEWRGEALWNDDPPARAAAPLALCRSVPVPGDGEQERLLEDLVVAPPAVRLLACAEWLDHARHAHLVDTATLGAWVRSATAVYIPVAARTDALLTRRLQRWAASYERRLESG